VDIRAKFLLYLSSRYEMLYCHRLGN